MFKSDSVRDILNLPRGPGPAFYKGTDAESKRALNQNPKKNWL